MVWIHTSYECERCRKRYTGYGEASRCESDHVTQDSIDRFGERLKEIFARPVDPTPQPRSEK